jgi:small subunit ribosomal protein S16
MLTIKLSRIGKKNQPMYRLMITEKSRDPYGRALELLGSYNPVSKALEVKQDRIKYWIGKGAQLSPTVHNLLVGNKIIDGEKIKKIVIAKKVEAEKSAEVAAEKTETKVEEKPAE